MGIGSVAYDSHTPFLQIVTVPDGYVSSELSGKSDPAHYYMKNGIEDNGLFPFKNMIIFDVRLMMFMKK